MAQPWQSWTHSKLQSPAGGLYKTGPANSHLSVGKQLMRLLPLLLNCWLLISCEERNPVFSCAPNIPALQWWAPNSYRRPYLKKHSVSLAIREMERKTTLRALLTLVRLLRPRKQQQMLMGMRERGSPCSLLVRLQTGATTMDINLLSPQKCKVD